MVFKKIAHKIKSVFSRKKEAAPVAAKKVEKKAAKKKSKKAKK